MLPERSPLHREVPETIFQRCILEARLISMEQVRLIWPVRILVATVVVIAPPYQYGDHLAF